MCVLSIKTLNLQLNTSNKIKNSDIENRLGVANELGMPT